MIKEAIILCGGDGKRLRGLTAPKILVRVANETVLKRQLEWLRDNGIERTVLATGYLERIIKAYVSFESSDWKLVFSSSDGEKLGTGGSLKKALDEIKGRRCIVVYGDILSNISLREIVKVHICNRKTLVTMFLSKMRSPYGIVELNGETIAEFMEKPILPYFISAGIFVMEKTVQKYLPDKGAMELKTFPKLAGLGLLGGRELNKNFYWFAIDTEKDVDEASEFIDRDFMEDASPGNSIQSLERPKS